MYVTYLTYDKIGTLPTFTQFEKQKSTSFWIGNEIVDTISDGK